MVKIVTPQGRPKSNRKQLPQLNFDFTVESIGKSEALPHLFLSDPPLPPSPSLCLSQEIN
jgi:hypothetical protein